MSGVWKFATRYKVDGSLCSRGLPVRGDIRVAMSTDWREKMLHPFFRDSGAGSIFVFVYDGQRWAWLAKRDKPALARKYSTGCQGRELVEQWFNHYLAAGPKRFSFFWCDGTRFAKIVARKKKRSKAA